MKFEDVNQFFVFNSLLYTVRSGQWAMQDNYHAANMDTLYTNRFNCRPLYDTKILGQSLTNVHRVTAGSYTYHNE